MLEDLLKDIDKIVNSYLDSVSPLFVNLVIKKLSMGGKNVADNLVKATPSSAILDSSRFTKLNEINKAYAKVALSQITQKINLTFNEFGDTLGLSIGRVKFLKDVKSTFSLLTKDIPKDIHKVLINKTALTLVSESNKAITADLAKAINKSVKQAAVLLKESMVILNRQKIKQVYDRLPKETLYKYVGPKDSKTSPICTKFLSLPPMTKKDWEKWKSDIFINGGHFGCRHLLVVWTEE